MAPPQKEPQAGPAGGVLEEGMAITGGDGSMHITDPEGSPVGQGVEVEDSE